MSDFPYVFFCHRKMRDIASHLPHAPEPFQRILRFQDVEISLYRTFYGEDFQIYTQYSKWRTIPCRLSTTTFQYIGSNSSDLETASSKRNPRACHAAVQGIHVTWITERIGWRKINTL